MRIALLVIVALTAVLQSITTLAAQCESNKGGATVSEVYPTADLLPENLLRFYIYFSNSMERENIFSSIYLADENGKRLDGVFLDNKFDLWSTDSTRLTVLMDPGRVKTGLVAHQSMGRALSPGQSYQLIIEASAKDITGCPLARRFVKSFRAIAADHQIPDIKQWQISQPEKGSFQALKVDLNGIVDHLSLAYRLRVVDVSQRAVAGSIEISKQEQQWIFTPDTPWLNVPYTLVVDPILEDIAGNRITGLFDQPLALSENEVQEVLINIPISLGKD